MRLPGSDPMHTQFGPGQMHADKWVERKDWGQHETCPRSFLRR